MTCQLLMRQVSRGFPGVGVTLSSAGLSGSPPEQPCPAFVLRLSPVGSAAASWLQRHLLVARLVLILWLLGWLSQVPLLTPGECLLSSDSVSERSLSMNNGSLSNGMSVMSPSLGLLTPIVSRDL